MEEKRRWTEIKRSVSQTSRGSPEESLIDGDIDRRSEDPSLRGNEASGSDARSTFARLETESSRELGGEGKKDMC
ncbi:hypothetical protein CesoFtcFv8_026333 [Champsocephalus esox]|uniref:Uncharacterized protein n=1 Tax=Champsocephalus esox TaxID=159716 RepID=A0AAN8B266_9TELE|nr:hypothetical protein CesoFtcFv8_026333 [Champsocephalus esox]